jgi:4-amino-4-deoxy-L-arabinose transferase-like glycosyltransferase
MEILTTTISFILLGGLIISPFIILYVLKKRNVKHKFLSYLTLGLIITATITLIFAWWTDISNEILLSHYGYDLDAMNDIERFTNVTEENMKRVKTLEISIMGIGWPLKAIMTYVFYSPFLLLVYLITYLFKKYKKEKEHTPNITYS